MIALIDLDSVLYKAVYKVVTISEMRTALTNFTRDEAEQWLKQRVYSDGIERCEAMIEEMIEHINSNFFDKITESELYITTCSNSFRKALAVEYKANRKRNKYVWMLREHYKNNGAFHSDTHEADDLIANRAKEIEDYIIVSMDKDLKQIGGHYWSYYKRDGEFTQQHVDYISQDEAVNYLWSQMLTGDPSDNIKGIRGIGPKKADKILSSSKCGAIAVMRSYIESGMKDQFRTNYSLLKLG